MMMMSSTPSALSQVSPTMCSEDLIDTTLEMKGIQAGWHDLWTTFEVIETGELGMKQTCTAAPIKAKKHMSALYCLAAGTLHVMNAHFFLVKKLLTGSDGIGAVGKRGGSVLPIACSMLPFL